MTKVSPLRPSISPSKLWQQTPDPPSAPGEEAPGWGGKSEHDAYLSSFPRGHGEVSVQSGLSSARHGLRTGLGRACSGRAEFMWAVPVCSSRQASPGELDLSCKAQIPQARPVKAHFPQPQMAPGWSSRTSLKSGLGPVSLPTGSWAE